MKYCSIEHKTKRPMHHQRSTTKNEIQCLKFPPLKARASHSPSTTSLNADLNIDIHIHRTPVKTPKMSIIHRNSAQGRLTCRAFMHSNGRTLEYDPILLSMTKKQDTLHEEALHNIFCSQPHRRDPPVKVFLLCKVLSVVVNLDT